VTKRAAIKTRVSSKGQKDDGTSLDTQEEQIRDYATKTGYEIVESLVISDVHSGTDLDCLGIAKLIRAAKRGQFDVLLFHSFSRFFRPDLLGDEWQALKLIAEFRDHGVSVEFIDGSVPNDPRYTSIGSVLAGLSSGDYRRNMLEATTRGTKAAIKEGKFTSRPPYGYDISEEGYLAIDEKQARIVRMIFDWYDRERIGVRKIQVRLNGVFDAPSRSPKKAPSTRWHQSTIYRILNSECYWSGRHSLGKTMGIEDGVRCPAIIHPEQAERV
jgi:site-specific DNA recombinase